MTEPTEEAVMRPTAHELTSAPPAATQRRAECNDRGVLLDRHVWDEARRWCKRCGFTRTEP